jgi:hypothetical protein
MKSDQINAGRLTKSTAGWVQGVNSVRNAWALPENQLKWGVNITVRGGIAQTRPGYAMRLSLPPGNLQGGIFFAANKQFQAAEKKTVNGQLITVPRQIFDVNGSGVAKDELTYMVFAVSGNVYFAPFPLEQPKDWEEYRLAGIKMDEDASQCIFALGTRSATTSTGGDTTVTPSHRIVMIQDGISAPAYWDGSNKTGVQSDKIPVGTWMAFSGNRMWIADNNLVLASDLGDPTSWLERTSGAGRGDFSFSRPVTGLVSYVGQNTDTRLIVFTDRSTFSLASGILDRSAWASTANFQNTLYPTVGCIAGKSIAFQAGQMWWYSQGGLVAADVAAASYLSSQVLYKDVEMARTKRYMTGNQSQICASSFENYLLYSVPYLEPVNSATMVLDYAAASEWGQARNPAWCGVWEGTRPVEWTTGVVDGQPRCFHFSLDYTATNDGSYNHLWESFMPERTDSYLRINQDGSTTRFYNRIYSQIETAQLGDGMDLKQFVYAEIECKEIGGTVDVRASFRGSKGAYQKVLDRRVMAISERHQYQNTPFESEIDELGFLNTQYRRLVTESATRNVRYETCESPLTADIDKAFSMLIEWCGELGVEIVRIFQDPWSEKSVGNPNANETLSCVVGENGDSLKLDILPSPLDGPLGENKTFFAKVYKTVTLPCVGFPSISATASASFLSFISYAHAEEQAGILALQAANAAAVQYKISNPC